MDSNIYCLVDPRGHVYVKDGAASHSDVAASFGLDALQCGTYRYDLSARRLLVDRGTPESDRAARAYWDQQVGTPEKLMTFAAQGHLPKRVLGSLLDTDGARAYVAACTAIEKQYTVDCPAEGNTCLESGCALEGEACLEPLMRAGAEYHKACGAAWSVLFGDPRHRIQAWMH